MIEWIEVGVKEPKVNKQHLITDGFSIGFGYYTYDGEEFNWYPDDLCNIDGDRVTHYSILNLP